MSSVFVHSDPPRPPPHGERVCQGAGRTREERGTERSVLRDTEAEDVRKRERILLREPHPLAPSGGPSAIVKGLEQQPPNTASLDVQVLVCVSLRFRSQIPDGALAQTKLTTVSHGRLSFPLS